MITPISYADTAISKGDAAQLALYLVVPKLEEALRAITDDVDSLWKNEKCIELISQANLDTLIEDATDPGLKESFEILKTYASKPLTELPTAQDIRAYFRQKDGKFKAAAYRQFRARLDAHGEDYQTLLCGAMEADFLDGVKLLLGVGVQTNLLLPKSKENVFIAQETEFTAPRRKATSPENFQGDDNIDQKQYRG